MLDKVKNVTPEGFVNFGAGHSRHEQVSTMALTCPSICLLPNNSLCFSTRYRVLTTVLAQRCRCPAFQFQAEKSESYVLRDTIPTQQHFHPQTRP